MEGREGGDVEADDSIQDSEPFEHLEHSTTNLNASETEIGKQFPKAEEKKSSGDSFVYIREDADDATSLLHKSLGEFSNAGTDVVEDATEKGLDSEQTDGNVANDMVEKADEPEVPEYDSDLNYLFFTKKPLLHEDHLKEEELRLKFYSTYKAFFENRQDLINSLRDIADEANRVQHNCNISHIVGGSVGIVGGAAALVGTVAFPPLFLGGFAIAGMAAVSNVGTTVTQFVIFRKLIENATEKSKYDANLGENLKDAYEALVSSELFDVEKRSFASKINSSFSSTQVHIGLDSVKGGVLALGVRTAGIGMVDLGSSLIKGLLRSAVGISIVIDGVTIYVSANDLAKGCNTKLSDALRKVADEKEKELEKIKKAVVFSGLFSDCCKSESRDSCLVLSRSAVASVL